MKVGSLVICVDDTNWAAEASHYFDKLPVAGKTYRIRRIMKISMLMADLWELHSKRFGAS